MSAKSISIASIVITLVGILSLSIALAIVSSNNNAAQSGLQGERGIKGEPGEPGPTGNRGVQGERGEQGSVWIELENYNNLTTQTIVLNPGEKRRWDYTGDGTPGPRLEATVDSVGTFAQNVGYSKADGKISLQPGFTYSISIQSDIRNITSIDTNSRVGLGMYETAAIENLYNLDGKPLCDSNITIGGGPLDQQRVTALGFITVETSTVVLYPGISSSGLRRYARLGMIVVVNVISVNN
jgi:hypothetical protein